MDSNEQDEFVARPYQIDLYEQALKENCIIFLPTGAGKTFIAVKLIKRLSSITLRPLSKGGKRTIFLVNTVPLVSQQCTYISRHTGLCCKGYSGDMNVDNWTDSEWINDFEKSQVLIMTTQILLDLLAHGIVSLNKINLLIFDECHRAVSDHPMRQVMQYFEICPAAELPHVLALSATLLNANIKLDNIATTIKMLETTFHARIATVHNIGNVQNFCANSQEISLRYEPYVIPSVGVIVKNYLDHAKMILDLAAMEQEIDQSSKMFQKQPTSKKLINLLKNIEELFTDMGLYGANIAALLYYVQLDGLKKYNKGKITTYILDFLITMIINIRKIFHDEMDGHSELDKIFKFSSDHVLQLIALLKQNAEHSEIGKKLCCIVFVQKRYTAQILYHILKILRDTSDDYKFISPTYILGYANNPYKSARESLCLAKWNNTALRNFRSGLINCIIATDVLDEGVDIPACTLVVRYNLPADFRAYAQSKGRARNKTSLFALLISKSDVNYQKRHQLYLRTQSYLQQMLVGKTNIRVLPITQEIKDNLYKHEIEPYIVIDKDGVKSVITEQQSISLVNRYCTGLYKSLFVKLTPIWELCQTSTVQNETYYQVSIKFPMVSCYKDTIFGNFMLSIKAAKRSAAMEACKILHKIGELTDRLLPVENSVILSDVNYLFQNWIEEDTGESNILGTYKKKRQHKIQYPEPLYGAFPQCNTPLYLHIIHTEPTYSVPQDNRHLMFYNLLQDHAGYAILSTKKLPVLPAFPIFMNVGELNVQVKPNHEVIILGSDDIRYLKMFHSLIFNQIIQLIKAFMMFDNENLDNSFLIVPVNKEWKIDWDIVKKYQAIERCKPSDPFQLKISDYNLALVEPSYRCSASVYIVTEVCEDITPRSCFPTDEFYSYTHYYQEKHSLSICNLEQPMLEVKPISTNINCVRPRSMKPGMSKRKRANVLEDFDEHLVPELCVKVNFPALYWLKATTLPSILHRISQLLVAEDFRTIVVKEACLGTVITASRNSWSQLELSQREADESSEPLLEATYNESVEMSQPETELNGPEMDVPDLETNFYPWPKEQEPIDLYRNIHQIKCIDLEYYHQFMCASSDEDRELLKHESKQIEYIPTPNIVAPSLQILLSNDENGPTSVEIMQALTSRMGHDIFDFERLEALGDSFLKFIVSLYLYHSFKSYTEGRLTALKGKIIGNRNLYYCGYAKNIPGRIKVDEFFPKSNFIVPAYSAFRWLQRLLIEGNISPNVLYELKIPAEERFSGYISDSTKELMKETITNWDTAEFPTGMEHFLGLQTVPDKAVADCVEALIGVYLKNMGPRGASAFLQWLGVLPNEINIQKLLHEVPFYSTPSAEDLNAQLQSADYIESKLKYKFKNRAYLLQALTHPSYSYNRITESYQRLEFLGDAIIDFLITSYIYENCTNLSPGALTDLRSALVNNITLGCLTVRYGFHTGLLTMSPDLTGVIDKFLKFQEGKDYAIYDELLWVLLEEGECNMSEYVEVPKILGDLFESLIGAVYFDSNKSLQKTWHVIYTLMHKEIDMFSKNVPKDPVRVLYETQGTRPTFMTTTIIDGADAVVVPLEVTIAGKQKLFHGFGTNKKQAKRAAAKQALKYIRCKQQK